MWLCEICALWLGFAWRQWSACTYLEGRCKHCDRQVPAGERREWHEGGHPT